MGSDATDQIDAIEHTRFAVARRFLRGAGIEVGALHPFRVGPDTRVAYVDRLSKAEALVHYPELRVAAHALVEPDIIDDGERLGTLADASQDFIIASHFLEHCENPLGTLRSHLRVIRPGGVLLLVVPNASDPAGWDAHREPTTFDHLVQDDRTGPETSREGHYRDWVTLVGGLTGDDAEREYTRLLAIGYSIHFHCWTPDTFPSFLPEAIRLDSLPATVLHYEANAQEMVAVLLKHGGDRQVPAARPDPLATENTAFHTEYARRERELSTDLDRLGAKHAAVRHELDVLRSSATFRLREGALRTPVLGESVRLAVRVAKSFIPRRPMLPSAPPRRTGPPGGVQMESAPVLSNSELLPFTAHRVELRPGVWTTREGEDPLGAASTRILIDRAGGSLGGKRVLDVGCLEGGYTVTFARLGARESIGLEVRESNLQRCRFLQEQLGLDNVRFVKQDARTISPQTLGTFDAIFASGLLYHLDEPVDFLCRAHDLTTDLLLLDTHVASPHAWAHACSDRLTSRTWKERSYAGREMYDCPADLTPAQVDRLHWSSYGNAISFWLTEDSLVQALWDVGFPYVSKAYMPRPYHDEEERCTWECRIIVVARKSWNGAS